MSRLRRVCDDCADKAKRQGVGIARRRIDGTAWRPKPPSRTISARRVLFRHQMLRDARDLVAPPDVVSEEYLEGIAWHYVPRRWKGDI